MKHAASVLVAVAVTTSGCAELGDPAGSLPPPIDVDGQDVPAAWRAPNGPCRLDPATPTRLLLTTTDFATGALTAVDLATRTITPDVAVGSTDAIPQVHDGRAVIVHRHRIDRIDVFDVEDWTLVGQHAVQGDKVSANPHAVVFDEAGTAVVTTFAEPMLRLLDLSRAPAQAERGRIDLSAFADDDGNPEASLAVACGDLVFVNAQRLDAAFVPVDTARLITVDTTTGEALDLDPSTEVADALPLMGGRARQLRRDPTDPSGRTLLALNMGIERIDLQTGVRTFAVSPDAMAQAGLTGRLQLQAFDVDSTGSVAYLSAYDTDFSQVQLYRVELEADATPVPFADGFDSVERTLELVDDTLWYGSTRNGEPGLWTFDVTTDPPTVTAGPLPTGLPPYSMVTFP